MSYGGGCYMNGGYQNGGYAPVVRGLALILIRTSAAEQLLAPKSVAQGPLLVRILADVSPKFNSASSNHEEKKPVQVWTGFSAFRNLVI